MVLRAGVDREARAETTQRSSRGQIGKMWKTTQRRLDLQLLCFPLLDTCTCSMNLKSSLRCRLLPAGRTLRLRQKPNSSRPILYSRGLKFRSCRKKWPGKRPIRLQSNRRWNLPLKRPEDLLEIERLHSQQAKSTMLEETEKSRAQLDEQKHENSTLLAALRNVEQKLESYQLEWQEEKTSLIQATEGFKKSMHDMQQEAKEDLERSQASHQAHLEEQKEETRKIASALNKVEDLLETERLSWQGENSSLLEEMTSLLHVTEGLKETMQEIQQERKEALERNASHQAEWQTSLTSMANSEVSQTRALVLPEVFARRSS
ncbi:uncharacterized protein LOC119016833 isoform X2 [Acanthopagrus latus]|uniref:uncharacterized protein LOC119016833 isoform X2 n=1 Tax=Acanthopagrus latus TaxID=8177 RepID=UPI00187C62FC|nr:uncharacterized protein LOC119016833 isoform X2 [Acanthopagrus latus]